MLKTIANQTIIPEAKILINPAEPSFTTLLSASLTTVAKFTEESFPKSPKVSYKTPLISSVSNKISKV